MSFTTFSIGRDTQLVVMGPNGRIDLEHVTAFESKQITQSVRVSRLDGTQLGTELPKGWEGSFELERGNSVVEDFIAATEQAYLNGGSSGSVTMYQYISETDGSVSTYQYAGVTLKLVNAGIWRGESSVKQKLEFFGVSRSRI
jgi:hypothetical protein